MQSEDLPAGIAFASEPQRPSKTDLRAADDEGRLYRVHGAWIAGEPGILHADLVVHAATVPKDEFPGDRFWDEIDRAIRR